VEAVIQAAVRTQGLGAPPPRAAHRTEMEVASDIVCKDLLGDFCSLSFSFAGSTM
jgi:hypothetical protein